MGKLINGVWVDWIEKVKILQKAVVQREDGLLLALKRPADAKGRANCWDLPGGSVEEEQIIQWKGKSGKGDKDDILIKSIEEEILQETKLQVIEAKTIHGASGFNENKGVFIVAIGYLCKVSQSSKVVLSEEHSEYKWATFDEFKNLEIGDDGGLIMSILDNVH